MANFIPEDKIREVRNSADIVEIVSESVHLKRTGKDFLGLCPFHTEKTPSFTVSPDKQMFYCFGCSVGGDVITFVRKQDGLSYPEAVKKLAGRYGIALPQRSLSPEQKKRMTERENLLRINGEAANFYGRCLLKSPKGKRAAAYLSRRGMTEKTLRQYKIGYAPDGWDHLLKFFLQKRVSAQLVERAGLIVARKSGSGHYDRLRGRVVFPIFNVNQAVIGFGGRVMDDSLPKYLNSPETPVFNKRRSLYGLDRARQASRAAGILYIVEGYFDVLALHQHGLSNTVATLGTSLTPEHVKVIRGLLGTAGKAVLVFDSDAAGLKAAKRSIEVFDRGQVDAHILVLPEGHDPDSFIREFGAEAFNRETSKAQTFISFLLASSIADNGLSIPGKMRILSEMIGPLAEIGDSFKRSLYVKEMAEQLDINEQDVLDQVRERAGKGADRYPVGKTEENRVERQIVSMMFQFPEILPKIRQLGALEFFEDATLQSIARQVLAFGDRPEADARDIFDRLAEQGQGSIAAALAFGDPAWMPEGCLKLIDRFVTSKRRRRDFRLIDQEIKSAVASDDQQQLIRLLQKKQQLATAGGKREKHKGSA